MTTIPRARVPRHPIAAALAWGRHIAPPLIVLVLLAGMLAAGAGACSWLKSESKQVAHDVVDCTKPAAVDAAKQFGPIFEAEVVQLSTPDGKLQAGPVADLVKSFAIETGGCVAAKVFASLLKPAPADPNAPKASELELDATSVCAVFEELRRERFAGKSFKLENGIFVCAAQAAGAVPADAMPVDALASANALAYNDAPKLCVDNLCGMDSYCSCHDIGGERRCWSTEQDCSYDAACCTKSGACHGMRKDGCTDATVAQANGR